MCVDGCNECNGKEAKIPLKQREEKLIMEECALCVSADQLRICRAAGSGRRFGLSCCRVQTDNMET